MAIAVPLGFIEHVLLGSGESRRQLQDSPILGDVWVAYAQDPAVAVDLLISSHWDSTANALAAAVYSGVAGIRAGDEDPGVAALSAPTGFIAARLYLDEVLRVVVPMTAWWYEPTTQAELSRYLGSDVSSADESLEAIVDDVASILGMFSRSDPPDLVFNDREPVRRFVVLGNRHALSAGCRSAVARRDGWGRFDGGR
jgi:serine protease AprX